MTTGGVRAGIILTAEDKTAAAFESVKRNMSGVQQQAGQLGGQVAGVAAKLGTIGVALGAAFSAASLKGAIDLADQLDDLSEKTGISVTQLSALRYAGEVTGTPLEALAGGVRKLAINLVEAAGGAKEQTETFRALGVNIKALDGSLKSSDQVLGEVADRFANFQDGPEKAALAVKLFGKAGADMIPLLNQGSAGIRDLAEEGRKLGAVVGEDFARQSAAFNDNLKKIELSIEGSKRTIAEGLVPTLNTLAEVFLQTQEGGTGFSELIGGTLKTALEASVVLFANVAFVLRVAGAEIGGVLARLQQLFTFSDTKQSFAAISEAVKEDAERARKELDDLERRILQTGTSLAGAGRGTAADPRVLGDVGSIREQAAAFKGRAPTVGGGAGAAKASDADRILKSIRERIALADQELTVGRALTEQETFAAKVKADLAEAAGKITGAQKEQILASLELAQSTDQRLKGQRDEAKLLQDQAKARNEVRAELLRQVVAQEQAVEGLQQGNAELRDEIALIGLTAEQQAAYTIAKNETVIAIKREQLARLDNGQTMTREQIALEEEIRLLEERNGLLGNRATRQASADAAKQVAEDWKRTAESINDSLTDALLRGFESGKGFAQNLRDTLVNMFKTLVLQPTVKAILAPLSGTLGSVGQAFAGGGGGGGGAAAAGSSPLSSIGSLSSLAGAAGAFGGGLSAGFGGLAGSVGSLFGAAGTGATLGGSLSAGGIALGAGNIAGGLGTLAGALGPIVLGVGAVLALAKGFKGERRSGGLYEAIAGQDPTFVRGPSGGQIAGGEVSSLIGATTLGINETLRQLGSSVKLDSFIAGLETSSKGRGGVLSGGTLSNGRRFGEDGSGSNYNGTLFERSSPQSLNGEQALQFFTEDLKQSTLQALQAADVPGILGDYLRGLGDVEQLRGGALDAAVNRINKALAEKQSLEARLADITATALDRLNKQRDAERAAIDESNRALLNQVFAAEDLKIAGDNLLSAYATEAAQLNATVDAHRNYTRELRTFRDALLLGDTSPLSSAQKLPVASQRFQDTLARAATGDADARADVTGSANDLLSAALAGASSRTEFELIFAEVSAGLTMAAAGAESQATIAEQQLVEMKSQLTALNLLNQTVQTFAQAWASYNQAQQNLTAAEQQVAAAQATQTVRQVVAPAVDPDPVIGTDLRGQRIRDSDLRNRAGEALFGGDQYYIGRDGRPAPNPYYTYVNDNLNGGGFATGGVFTNGIVDRPTKFNMGLMGEAGPEAIMPLANIGGRLGVRAMGGEELPGLLRELLAEMKQARSEGRMEAAATVSKLDKLVSTYRKWDTVGTPPVREEASS